MITVLELLYLLVDKTPWGGGCWGMGCPSRGEVYGNSSMLLFGYVIEEGKTKRGGGGGFVSASTAFPIVGMVQVV